MRGFIAKARKEKKNLISTTVLLELVVSAGLSLHVLTIFNNTPILLGSFEVLHNKTLEEICFERLRKILIDFKQGSGRFLHFICCMKAIRHGFLITLGKRRNILTCHTNVMTQKHPEELALYVACVKQCY